MSKKEKFPLYLSPEKKAILERRYQEDGSRSITAFIERAVDFYLDYLSANNAGLFLPTSIQSYLDGRLEHGPIQNLYDNIDTVGADPGYKARVDVLCIEETVAIVRVLEDNWGGRINFSDFLLLIKMDGEWRAVAKVYNQNSDTIKRD